MEAPGYPQMTGAIVHNKNKAATKKRHGGSLSDFVSEVIQVRALLARYCAGAASGS